MPKSNAKPNVSPTRIMGETRVDKADKNPGAPSCLVFIAGDRIGHKVTLTPGRIQLGRDPTSEIPLTSDLVSRNHARLLTSTEQTVLVDLGSTNGTFVNDQRVRDRVLEDGDRISIGHVVAKYLAAGNAEAAYHDEVFRLVSHDGLTEVYNRRYYDERLQEITLQQQASPNPVAVLLFDADHFKRVNDKHGHAAGDAVLRQVARRASALVQPPDFLARVGGEEFGVVLRGQAAVDAIALAESIRHQVSCTAVRFGSVDIEVTVSVGVAWEPAPMQLEPLVRRADERLYEAKQHGRNRVCWEPLL